MYTDSVIINETLVTQMQLKVLKCKDSSHGKNYMYKQKAANIVHNKIDFCHVQANPQRSNVNLSVYRTIYKWSMHANTLLQFIHIKIKVFPSYPSRFYLSNVYHVQKSYKGIFKLRCRKTHIILTVKKRGGKFMFKLAKFNSNTPQLCE